jgi:protein-disulfide isomerase
MSDDMPILAVPVNAQDHIQGLESAPVTLVEYGDYECPHCGAAFPIIKAVQKKLGPNLRFVFRNFPLSYMHPFAELAAEAAEAAGAQGKFWEMHDAIYENQESLGEEMIEGIVQELKLDVNRFNSDIKARKFKEHVRKDFIGGAKSGVNGTPSLFINGERFDESLDEETLIKVIHDSFLSKKV